MSVATAPIPALACPQCGTALAPDALGVGIGGTVCPQCRSELHGALFPAFWKSHDELAIGAQTASEGEADCFFHPENRAALSCEKCGRFICSVCEFTVGTRHICPTCLSSGLAGEKLPELIPWRFIWSDAALFMGIVPLFLGMFLWPFFIGSGAAAIFLAIFGWKRPGSLPRGRRRWAAIVGIFGGALQMAIWLAFVIFLYTLRNR